MIERTEIEEKVINYLKNELDFSPECEITKDSKLVDDLGLDSLDIIEVVMFAESEFGFQMNDLEAEECETVNDFCNLVEKTLKENE